MIIIHFYRILNQTNCPYYFYAETCKIEDKFCLGAFSDFSYEAENAMGGGDTLKLLLYLGLQAGVALSFLGVGGGYTL